MKRYDQRCHGCGRWLTVSRQPHHCRYPSEGRKRASPPPDLPGRGFDQRLAEGFAMLHAAYDDDRTDDE